MCIDNYDEAVRRPRSLPCGHIVCTPCIEKLRERDPVTCPTCRGRHAVPEGGQFPVCYAMENLLPILQRRDDPTQAADLGRQISSLLLKQEGRVLAAIQTCQGEQARLDEYQKSLEEPCEQQELLEDILPIVLDKTRTATSFVRQEQAKAAATKEEAKEKEQKLNGALKALRRGVSPQEAYTVINDADHLTEEVRQRAEEWQRVFPNADPAAARKVSVAQLRPVLAPVSVSA